MRGFVEQKWLLGVGSSFKYEKEYEVEKIGTDTRIISLRILAVRSTFSHSLFSAQVKSRGNIVHDEQQMFVNGERSTYYNLAITRDMIPSAMLIVSYVNGEGEIVADFIEITVKTSLLNQVGALLASLLTYTKLSKFTKSAREAFQMGCETFPKILMKNISNPCGNSFNCTGQLTGFIEACRCTPL